MTIRTVGLVGTGVIGAGWAARCLFRGLDVVATDPSPGAEDLLRASVDLAWPSMAKLTQAPLPSPGRLTFVSSLEEVAGTADLVQESAPERLELKRSLFQAMDRVAGPEVILASSSSGLLPSEIQAGLTRPGRMVIGHPFNPVYLLPLCEVLGGQETDPETVERAMAFYTSIGMHALKVRKEVEGYISDRLQEALWREALHMVNDGIASTDEIDAAIAYGPGLRWSFWGTCLIFHLAGGEGGMRAMLEMFGPALEWPWTRLKAPELTGELIERMVEGCEAQAAGRSIRELARTRDAALVDVIRALRPHELGAGATLAADEARLYGRIDYPRWKPDTPVDAPLQLYRGGVNPSWVDYNGHMSEGSYLWAFGDASDALFRYVGIDEAYRAAGHSFYTVESHINYLREVGSGDRLRYTTQLLDLDEKRLHLFHEMFHDGTGELVATTEQMLMHVDSRAQRSAPIQPEVLAALTAIFAVHKDRPRPDGAGRTIGIRRKG
ncbi:3-hydroxyacyl-CoA dehydrogenase NAD-binding domain-containing protein [Geminicoccus roseus]|uniref:3-hydroxyacyl-CoA dehydrogenase NAD-binding domain-containing protein n=1 Tax=Geminicoccus roseus TaxID=404900 RepID=UPI0003FA99E0|nr:3-hydroxyacyl-CoA dehydrogenase NAD-binding domain-containing protein [Geminicoccus roseus]